MRQLLLGIFLFLSFVYSGFFVTMPLVFDVLLLYYVFFKDEETVFIASFIVGIFLDSITVRTIGESSIFFMVVLFIVMLYRKKFEITTWPFVACSSFLGGFAYYSIFGFQDVFLQSIFNSLFTVALFLIAQLFLKEKKVEAL